MKKGEIAARKDDAQHSFELPSYNQVSGSGWLKLEKKHELTRWIKFHSRDNSA